MIEYPKIDNLYRRDEKAKRLTPDYRRPEFGIIDRWLVTEKIDGTNIRVILHKDGTVTYGGRTDRAQFSATLYKYLADTFPAEKVRAALEKDGEERNPIILFGEGYSPKIQNGGCYRNSPGFRLFDVAVLTPKKVWWLEWRTVEEISAHLGIKAVTAYLMPKGSIQEIVDFVAASPQSLVAAEDGGKGCCIEGIVARTTPTLFDRMGRRVMFKLKVKDVERMKEED